MQGKVLNIQALLLGASQHMGLIRLVPKGPRHPLPKASFCMMMTPGSRGTKKGLAIEKCSIA